MSDRWTTVVVFIFVGLMLLVLLWPTAANGRRLLKKWEVPDPTDAQVEDAVRYLKRRRLLYPWLYPAIGYFTPLGNGNWDVLVTVFAGTLLAELLALRPRREARRVATLTPRGLRDIASKWVLLCYVAIVITSVIYLVIDWRPWQILWLVLSVIAVSVVTWAAVARPANGDEIVDMALRTRSVHFAAGLGAAVAGALPTGFLGLIGIVAWIAMANTKPQRAKIDK